MTTFVALLRGINVGSHDKLPMAELRALFEAQGHQHVSTYIQNDNVIFSSDHDEDALVPTLSEALQERFGFAIPVVVRDRGALQVAARSHPLAAIQPDERLLHVVFLGAVPAPEAMSALDLAAFLPDELAAQGREVYVAYRDGSGRSKLTIGAIERAVGTTATGRNWRTVTKLAELLAAAR